MSIGVIPFVVLADVPEEGLSIIGDEDGCIGTAVWEFLHEVGKDYKSKGLRVIKVPSGQLRHTLPTSQFGQKHIDIDTRAVCRYSLRCGFDRELQVWVVAGEPIVRKYETHQFQSDLEALRF